MVIEESSQLHSYDRNNLIVLLYLLHVKLIRLRAFIVPQIAVVEPSISCYQFRVEFRLRNAATSWRRSPRSRNSPSLNSRFSVADNKEMSLWRTSATNGPAHFAARSTQSSSSVRCGRPACDNNSICSSSLKTYSCNSVSRNSSFHSSSQDSSRRSTSSGFSSANSYARSRSLEVTASAAANACQRERT